MSRIYLVSELLLAELPKFGDVTFPKDEQKSNKLNVSIFV